MSRTYMRGPFWTKVNKDGPVIRPELGSCWVWLASTDSHGYGKVMHPQTKRLVKAHRHSWELEVGPIPPGLWVLHKCDNPPCLRPSHLFLGTHIDNTEDKVKKGRSKTARIPRGANHTATFLTDDMVRAMRYQFIVEKTGVAEIARQRGLKLSHVLKIIQRIRWMHIP